MRRQLFLGLAVEGNTDMRFLESVVRRSFERIVFDECNQEVDIEIFQLNVPKTGKSFPEFVAAAAKIGLEKYGILTLVIHTDSDKDSLEERLKDKFEPAYRYLQTLSDNNYCKVITPVIPMRMVEAWMMADIQLLLDEIGTSMTATQLGIKRSPESIADPKSTIINAISIAQENLPKKRRTLSINDLYEIIGGKIDLKSLDKLSSYCAFKEFIHNSLMALHYLD